MIKIENKYYVFGVGDCRTSHDFLKNEKGILILAKAKKELTINFINEIKLKTNSLIYTTSFFIAGVKEELEDYSKNKIKGKIKDYLRKTYLSL